MLHINNIDIYYIKNIKYEYKWLLHKKNLEYRVIIKKEII